MKRSRIRAGSRSVVATAGLLVDPRGDEAGPVLGERARRQAARNRPRRRPRRSARCRRRARSRRYRPNGGRGRLRAGDLVDAVVHHDDHEVLRPQHRDGGERAQLHQERAVALERHDRRARLRQRDAERDRHGKPHAAEHVEILRPPPGGPEIEIGVADAGRPPPRRAELARPAAASDRSGSSPWCCRVGRRGRPACGSLREDLAAGQERREDEARPAPGSRPPA